MSAADVDRRERLARLALFADLPKAEVEALARRYDEVSFGEGQWVIRRGEMGTALYLIVDGEVGVVIDDEEIATLSTGSFFGEVSLLLGEPAIAGVVTRTPLRCLVIPEPELEDFLLTYPRVMFNMLRTEARRVRSATEWHS